MTDEVLKHFRESSQVKLLFAETYSDKISEVAGIISNALKDGNKVLIFGNGGSASDAQHIAAELIGRFKLDRRPLPAIALSADSSILTALANDIGFETIFERQIEALCMPGDIAIGISTSGRSKNVIRGLLKAKGLGATTIAFTGKDGGELVNLAHYCFVVPSYDTARVQECHITLAHVLCELIERGL
ncbi:MAG: D-sedoheptulose 7-phosphate isomerase [Aquificaceae bacterium]|nr:D-sedoheptulose 7-phosphate isomerase [Aquificaceae bacterium]MDW8237078.1 D-sedoheptulose 7-phosphate isomerase [Aquificaceae bacterium]